MPCWPAHFICATRFAKHHLEVVLIIPANELDLSLHQRSWPFALDNRQRIDRHWASLTADNPANWNGEVLMAYDISSEGDRFSAKFMNTDYASFIAWRDWGWPDREVFNCFGSAVVRSRDGALIYGRMADHTLNAGLHYPPGGSLEPGDVLPDGSIDVDASIARELREETGLETAQANDHGTWLIFDGQRIAIARLIEFPASATELLQHVEQHISEQSKPELSHAVAFYSRDDLDKPMPGFARQLALQLLPD